MTWPSRGTELRDELRADTGSGALMVALAASHAQEFAELARVHDREHRSVRDDLDVMQLIRDFSVRQTDLAV